MLFVLGLFLAVTTKISTDSSSTEWIKVYFSQPAQHQYSRIGVKSNSAWELSETLIQLVDSAQRSVDLCIYDLENLTVVESLVRAKKRGVKVRIVTDNYNRTDSKFLDPKVWKKLREAEIISIDDDGDIYMPDGTIIDTDKTNAGAQMHNKFAVIDYETPSKDDDYVWTGSTNLTATGMINTNTVLVLKDDAVAHAYRQEFDQMWGGSAELPDQKKSAFHKDKKDVDEHVFWVGETKVEIYFAPINRDRSKPSVSDQIVRVLKTETQNDISFCAFSISTNIPISQTIWSLTDNPEIKLRGVIDRRFFSRYEKRGDFWASEAAKSRNRRIYPANELRILHHKTIIIDAEHDDPDDQAVVITGSYNFSNAAEKNNDENLLIIYSDEIADQYLQDYMGVFDRARGEMEVPAPRINLDSTYAVAEILDGSRFTIEITHGFDYEVQLVGVESPRIWPNSETVSLYAPPSRNFLSLLLEGSYVRLSSEGKYPPASKYGRFYAYVFKQGENDLSVNQQVLEAGWGRYVPYFYQPDHLIQRFQDAESGAKEQKQGIWKNPDDWDTQIENPFASFPHSEEGNAGVQDSKKAEDEFPINVNTAGVKSLVLLPRIGESLARRIIEYREANGPFQSLEELTKVKGIGKKTVEGLNLLATVSEEGN